MIELVFGLGDAANVRFAVSPVAELVWSLIALRKPDRRWLHRPWRDQVAGRVTGTELLQALTGGSKYLPDFLTPTPLTARPTLAQELAAIEATPPELVSKQVRMVDRADPLLDAFAADPGAGMRRLTAEMGRYFELALAPDWARLRALSEADIHHRTAIAAAQGWLGLLSDLHPQLRWDGGRLTVHLGTIDFDRLDGRPMVLVPCSFAWPNIHTTNTAGTGWAVAYPPRGVGRLWSDTPREAPAQLAALLGSTRAAVLAALDHPLTTHEAARLLRLAPSTASHHLTTLLASELVIGHRDGRTVRYVRTPLGDRLTGSES